MKNKAHNVQIHADMGDGRGIVRVGKPAPLTFARRTIAANLKNKKWRIAITVAA